MGVPLNIEPWRRVVYLLDDLIARATLFDYEALMMILDIASQTVMG